MPTNTKPPAVFDPFTGSGYVRQSQLVANPARPERPALLPFSSATLWRKVRSGEFPRPVKLSQRVTAWRLEDVRAWMQLRSV